MRIKEFFGKFLSPRLKYILFLFLATRIILIFIGFISINELKLHGCGKPASQDYSSHRIFSMWGVHDSGWYLQIAKTWYPDKSKDIIPTDHGEYSMFPLYPLLMRMISKLTGYPFIVGILLSNLFLILAAIFLFKLAELKYDSVVAKHSVCYLFLFPTSFIFSGVFSESLYLFLLLACFYYYEKGSYFLSGVTGFFLSLSRVLGVFSIIALSTDLILKSKSGLKPLNFKLIYLILIPVGLLLFMLMNKIYSGDYLMFARNAYWNGKFSNPFLNLWEGLSADFFTFNLLAWFTIIFLLVPAFFYKQIPLHYHLVILYSALVPLSFGLMSMPRMCMVAFPFYILLARLTKKYNADQYIVLSLALLQGCFAVFWFNAYGTII